MCEGLGEVAELKATVRVVLFAEETEVVGRILQPLHKQFRLRGFTLPGQVDDQPVRLNRGVELSARR